MGARSPAKARHSTSAEARTGAGVPGHRDPADSRVQQMAELAETFQHHHQGHMIGRVVVEDGVVQRRAQLPVVGAAADPFEHTVLGPQPAHTLGGHLGPELRPRGRAGPGGGSGTPAPQHAVPLLVHGDRRHPAAAADPARDGELHIHAQRDPLRRPAAQIGPARHQHRLERLPGDPQQLAVGDLEVEVTADEAVRERYVVVGVRQIDHGLPDGLGEEQRIGETVAVRVVQRMVPGPLGRDQEPVRTERPGVGEEDLRDGGPVDHMARHGLEMTEPAAGRRRRGSRRQV